MMSSFQGVLPTPNAVIATKNRIKALDYLAIVISLLGLFSCVAMYFVLSRIETLDERAILPIVAFEAITMIGLFLYFRKQSQIIKNVVDKVAGNEVIFFPSHVEFAATIFQHPNPKAALMSQHPYLKIQYRDIQSVRMISAPKGNVIEILMMNDNRISMNCDAFAETEQKFFSALHSHKVSVPTLA